MATKKLGSAKATDTILVTSVNLAADVGATVLPVANGGSGTGTYTDGQLLIGVTSGNTLSKGTLTGTANQVIVTNGGGSITLGLPSAVTISGTGARLTVTGVAATGSNLLALGGTTTSYAYATITNSGGSFWVALEGSAAGTMFTGSMPYASLIGSAVSTALQLATNAIVGLTMDASQNVGIGTTAPTAALDTPASTTTRSGLRVRSGTAPTSPNDGDIWYDGTNLKIRIGGTTKTII